MNQFCKICPRCRQTTVLDAAFCPRCGRPFHTQFAAPPPARGRSWAWSPVQLLAVIVLVMILIASSVYLYQTWYFSNKVQEQFKRIEWIEGLPFLSGAPLPTPPAPPPPYLTGGSGI